MKQIQLSGALLSIIIVLSACGAFAKEKLDTMRAFGAKLEVIHSPSGKINSNLINQMVDRAKELATKDDYFFF